jgi:pimeloyl-ACP methyl ester carboxylesterase
MTASTVREWRHDGCWLPPAGGNAFVRSGSGHGPAVLALHGFPSSSYDFRSIINRLGQRSWLTRDFLGFGLPDKPAWHTYNLMEQADIVQQMVARRRAATAQRASGQLKKLDTAVASSGDADVARFW